MTIRSGDFTTAKFERLRFHDQKPVLYSSLIEDELRRRFGDVEEAFVDLTRAQSVATVVVGLRYTRTLAGAFRIWRAERRGRNRRAILQEADRRIIALEEVE